MKELSTEAIDFLKVCYQYLDLDEEERNAFDTFKNFTYDFTSQCFIVDGVMWKIASEHSILSIYDKPVIACIRALVTEGYDLICNEINDNNRHIFGARLKLYLWFTQAVNGEDRYEYLDIGADSNDYSKWKHMCELFINLEFDIDTLESNTQIVTLEQKETTQNDTTNYTQPTETFTRKEHLRRVATGKGRVNREWRKIRETTVNASKKEDVS